MSRESDYLRHSFVAVDGLWFMKVEEAYGLEVALELDARVWEVTGKIQARTAQKVLGLEDHSLATLAECLRLKFSAENYQADVELDTSRSLTVSIQTCPWLKVLQKAERIHLAGTIATKICTADFGAWALEFGKELDFSPTQTRCGQASHCRVRFLEQLSR